MIIMNNNQFLNEEKYQKIKKKMKIIALISLIIGLALFAVAIFTHIPAMSEDGWFEAKHTQSLLFFGGFIFTIMIPLPLLFMSHARDIAAFQAQSMMPVAKEGVKEMAPTMGQTAGTIMKEMAPAMKEMAKEMAPVYGEMAKEVGKGISEGINEAKQNEEK